MAGASVSKVKVSSVKRAAALFLLGLVALVGACSSDTPTPPKGNGDIPPPLNQPCDDDLDCEAFGLKCDPLRGCLPCVFDWHCAEGERCTDDGCKVPSQCSTDSDCSTDAKAPHCDPVLSECVGCRFESDCPESSHCKERSCTPYTPCVNSRDCADGTVCDRDRGECVECLANGDCEAGKEVCVAAHCVPVCSSDKDCLSRNQLCHHSKGYCADCVEQEDCPSVYYCSDDLCKLDVCKPGSKSCLNASTQGVCNALGSAVDPLACPVSTTCSEDEAGPACRPWICTPGTKDCDPTGALLRECAQDGLSYASETDCSAEGELCYLAECRPKVCEPGSKFCQGLEVRECTANGTASTVLSSCFGNQYCDEATTACVPQSCTPDQAMCDGDVATTCDALGSGPVPDGTDCAESDEICVAGSCKPVVCESAFCQDGNAWSCRDHGTSAELAATCTADQYCRDGSCFYDRCIAGAGLCENNVASKCKADGSGAEPDGTNCTETNSICQNGACVPKVCEPNTYYCSEGSPYRCNSAGTAPSYQSDECPASYHCKPGQAYCVADVCTTGAKVCDGNRATTCNAEGSGPAPGGTDCTATGKVCQGGSCLPKICEPLKNFCQGGNLYACGSTGATSTLTDTCLASEFCDPAVTFCRTDVCTPSTPTCNGDNLSTCAADGSGPSNAGTSCGAGKTCHSGACKAVICTVDTRRCSAGNVQVCVEKGTAWAPLSTCDGNTYCNELATPIVCSLDICAAGENACDGEKLATCQSDGGHFTAVGTNCATTSKVCSLTHACLTTAEDTVADTTSSATLSSHVVGNVYRVDRKRKLTEIEQYVSVTGTSVFTWVVYEGADPSGTFTKLFELTTSSSGAGAFHSSGAIDVTLQAGKHYFIGVIVQGSFTTYFVDGSFNLPFVSFGQWVNAYQTSMATAPQNLSLWGWSRQYHQRVSTAYAP